jgi:hypothetical protein
VVSGDSLPGGEPEPIAGRIIEVPEGLCHGNSMLELNLDRQTH